MLQKLPKRTLKTTSDGSPTLYIEAWQEPYHSLHGAIAEAKHVFINAGLCFVASSFKNNQNLSVLEMGFGTGLNAFLTAFAPCVKSHKVHYTTLEAYPLNPSEYGAIKYTTTKEEAHFYKTMHKAVWETPVTLLPKFVIEKKQQHFQSLKTNNKYHLVYYDAFGARVQPELWEASIFQSVFNVLEPSGVLVTYAAKGSVRRALQSVGFKIERLPGPPGKREMLRAIKN